MDLIPTKRHSELLQDGFGHVVAIVQPELPEVALVLRQVTGAEDTIREIEEAPVIRTAAWKSHRMVGSMMSRRIQKFIEEAALEVRVGVVEQARDAGEDVVKDDDLVINAEEQKGEGSGRNRQEDVDRVEVRGAEHFEPVQAVMDGVITPEKRHLMSPTVIPVLREVDDQRDEQQLEQDMGVARPDIKNGDVVVIAGRCRQDADQEKNVEVVNRRGRHEVQDVCSAGFADCSPALLVGDVEFERSNQNEHEDIEAVGHDPQRERSSAIDAPPQNSEGEKQDGAVRKSTHSVADPVRLKAALRSVDQLLAHSQSSSSQARSVSPDVGAQRIGRPAGRFTDSYRVTSRRYEACPRVVGHWPARRALRLGQPNRRPLSNRGGAESGLKGERKLRGIQL